MKQTLATRLSAVVPGLLRSARPLAAGIRLAAALTGGLWLSSCDDDTAPVLSPRPADAQLRQRMDSLWAASMRDGTVPGMSVVVIRQGKTFFQKNYGYADLQARTPVTANTRFAIGSTTKAMTALAVLRLVDQGVIKLNEKVVTYLPDFVMRDARYRDIQVKHLLANSSGLQSFTSLTPPDNSSTALEGLLPILAQEDLAFAPGSDYYYSNYGFSLAGLLIQRVTNMPYEAYMRQYVFNKIGMPATTMEYWQPNALAGTKGYVLDAQNTLAETQPYFNRLYNPAGGGSITTITDVARYLTVLANGTAIRGGEKLLSDSLATRLFTGTINADNDDLVEFIGAQGATYGFGWYNVNRQGYITIEHGGNTDGMLSYFFVDPKTKSAVGILANREDFSKQAVAAEVARLIFAPQ